MERCDFSSVVGVIQDYINEVEDLNQMDFLYLMFESFINSDEGKDFDFDNGLVCRWIKGKAKVSIRILKYYLKKQNKKELVNDLYKNLFPRMSDSSMAISKIYELVRFDCSISMMKKWELRKNYSNKNMKKGAEFIADVLCFGMNRNFVKRDNRAQHLLAQEKLSIVLSDFIMNGQVPKPCKYFCGRDKELVQLHELLKKDKKVFLQGISGIGKSELAKAYAKYYKEKYTNILYICYSGDLKKDIIELDFIDDDNLEQTEEECFQRHNRILRFLKEDTLLIIDNFNIDATQEKMLSVLMKYRCKILFTTRNRMSNYTSMRLEEIKDNEFLLRLVENFYPNVLKKRKVIQQIIDMVHSHTFVVELVARLLERGILEPEELLCKLKKEKVALKNTDRIDIIKDGKVKKETYYGHIHMLFSLCGLSIEEQEVMCNMAVIPASGISARRFAKWMGLSDMNSVNHLIEMGFINSETGYSISLHPMIQEITVVDIKPSISKCKKLCDSIQEICLYHGRKIPYYKVLFQTVENIISLKLKDDILYYIRFLEDVFAYMDGYQYESGLQSILKELTNILKDSSVGSVNDRALLLDYKASREKNIIKAIQLEKDAINMLTDITEENALLVANIHANLGALYRVKNQINFAKQQMENSIIIMEQYNLIGMNDCIPQICNYAILLKDIGESEKGMKIVKKLEYIIKREGLDLSLNYEMVQEAISFHGW